MDLLSDQLPDDEVSRSAQEGVLSWLHDEDPPQTAHLDQGDLDPTLSAGSGGWSAGSQLGSVSHVMLTSMLHHVNKFSMVAWCVHCCCLLLTCWTWSWVGYSALIVCHHLLPEAILVSLPSLGSLPLYLLPPCPAVLLVTWPSSFAGAVIDPNFCCTQVKA